MNAPDFPGTGEPQIVIEVHGRGEWIADGPTGARSLHIYRLARTDWLVSEVGLNSEGRGSDLATALSALAGGASAPGWWRLLLDTLDRPGS